MFVKARPCTVHFHSSFAFSRRLKSRSLVGIAIQLLHKLLLIDSSHVVSVKILESLIKQATFLTIFVGSRCACAANHYAIAVKCPFRSRLHVFGDRRLTFGICRFATWPPSLGALSKQVALYIKIALCRARDQLHLN